VRIAALYDVHGNIRALEAVLVEVEREGVDAIVFGGDLVGGPFPDQTLALVRATDAHYVRGNGDRDTRSGPQGEWVDAQLDDDDRAWLAALPPTVVLDDVLFCHATPTSDMDIVTVLSPDERLQVLFRSVDQALVVCGHTHTQYDRRAGSVRVVNAGSVGLPYEDEPGAYWAIVGDDVELRRTTYDFSRAADEIAASGMPDAAEYARENVVRVPSAREAAEYFETLVE
jgi:putative phosphoesterase